MRKHYFSLRIAVIARPRAIFRMSHKSKITGKAGRSQQNPLGLEKRRRKRFVRYLRRNLKKAKSTLSEPRYRASKQAPRSPLLDGLYPKRRHSWIPKAERFKEIDVDLSRFSFVDHPGRAMRTLRDLIRADCAGKRIKINFLDVDCLDVAPYLVMAMMEQSLGAPENIIGGTISARMRRVLMRVRLPRSSRCARKMTRPVNLMSGRSAYNRAGIHPAPLEKASVRSTPESQMNLLRQ